MAESELYPLLDGGGSIVEQRFNKNDVYPDALAGKVRIANQVGLTGSYSLDLWGESEAEYLAALGQLRASEIDAQAARLDLAAAIAQTYVRLAGEFDQLDISRDLLRQKQEIRSLNARQVRAGLVTEVETRQAEAEIAANEERIALLRHDLAALVGGGPDRGKTIERPSLTGAAEPGDMGGGEFVHVSILPTAGARSGHGPFREPSMVVQYIVSTGSTDTIER